MFKYLKLHIFICLFLFLGSSCYNFNMYDFVDNLGEFDLHHFITPINEYNGFLMAIGPDNKPVITYFEDKDVTGTNEVAKYKIKKYDYGTKWKDLGYIDSGNYLHGIMFLGVDFDNSIIVAHRNLSESNKVFIKKLINETDWVDLGYMATDPQMMNIKIGNDGTLIIALSDTLTHKIKVFKLVNNNWIDLGLDSTNTTGYFRFDVGSDNKPVIVYEHRILNCDTTSVGIKKFNAINDWVDLPTPNNNLKYGISDIALTIDRNNKPVSIYREYISENDAEGKVRVKRLEDGNNWIDLDYKGGCASPIYPTNPPCPIIEFLVDADNKFIVLTREVIINIFKWDPGTPLSLKGRIASTSFIQAIMGPDNNVIIAYYTSRGIIITRWLTSSQAEFNASYDYY